METIRKVELGIVASLPPGLLLKRAKWYDISIVDIMVSDVQMVNRTLE